MKLKRSIKGKKRFAFQVKFCLYVQEQHSEVQEGGRPWNESFFCKLLGRINNWDWKEVLSLQGNRVVDRRAPLGSISAEEICKNRVVFYFESLTGPARR